MSTEEIEVKRGIGIFAWSAVTVLLLMAYAGSGAVIILIESLGYLDVLYDTPFMLVVEIYCLPLQLLYEYFPPYTAYIDFMQELVT